MAKRLEGYRNLSELTEHEKDIIIEKYYQKDMKVNEMFDYFKVTKRTIPALFKERGIHSKRKNRYSLNENYFKEVDTERKAYWLGYLYADGFVGDGHFNNIVFVQKITDGYAVEQFAKDIEFTGDLRTTKTSGGFEGELQKVLNFSSETMANDLKKLKMETCKSMTMEELPPINKNLMRHFVRGYFDGDGSISMTVRHAYTNRKHNYSYRCSMIGTLPFLTKVADLLPVRVNFVDSHTPEMKYLYVWHKDDMETMFHYLYDDATFYLERKYKIWIQILGDIGAKTPIDNGINPQGVSA